MSRLPVLFALVALAPPAHAALHPVNQGVCNLDYCSCTDAIHPAWTSINCTVPMDTYWADKKCALKKTCAQRAHLLRESGRGADVQLPDLTPIDQRLVAVMGGAQFAEGDSHVAINPFPSTKLDVVSMDLPVTAMELTVNGAETVMFGAGAFNGVKDIRRIAVNGAKIVVFRQFAAISLSILNLYLDIENCEVLRFEKRAFQQLKGPMSVTISDCDTVSVEGDTFSWLLNLKISNVRELTLGIGSFSLDPSAANVGEHGPGMSIQLRDLTIPEFSKSTFGSSAAKVLMEGVDIHAIRTGAFSANTYNVVMAINCSIHLIEEEAFSENSLINYLNLNNCKIQQLASRALRSAIANINITHTRFDNVETGAISTTVASVTILNSEFHNFMEKGFELSSWNFLRMENNSFDELPANAIAAPGASIHKLIFNDNEIETMHPESLAFIGRAATTHEIEYTNNYYGEPCNCNISTWLAKVLGTETSEPYEEESYCTVNEFFARCFNVPEQNMKVHKFLHEVCNTSPEIKCEQYKSKSDGAFTEIKNPRFPHKSTDEKYLSQRNAKVIGIVVVSCLGCVIIAMLFSFIRWMRRRGYCYNFKNFLISSNTTCGTLCGRMCSCGTNLGLDNARSISQLSVNEYSERHRLNESRAQDLVQESSFQDVVVPTEEKFTQTLPEELTKELLENLKERLDNPENYVEAREMIEHLYELTKMTEEVPQINTQTKIQENIYDMPFQNTAPRVGRNQKKMVSVGTRAPSVEKLMPLSPYYRQTALSHEYFEPKDLAVHLYAEIANNEKERKTLLGTMPDVIAEQAIPRGPYLRAVLAPSSTPATNPSKSYSIMSSPISTSSLKSPTSTSPSGKMLNRPLPDKPAVDPGEGTSFKHG